MTLSIVIPAYNASAHIRDTLQSIKDQRVHNYQVILVDSCSTDDTVEIFESYKFHNAIVISEPDTGLPDALNKGFSAATGSVLCWLNADDVYLSPHATLLAEDAMMKKSFTFAYGSSAVLDEGGFIRRVLLCSRPVWSHRHHNLFTGSLFFSRDEWAAFGKFSGKYRISFEHELRKFLFSRSDGLFLNKIIAGLRIHKNTLTSMNSETIQKEKAAIYGSAEVSLTLSALDRLLSWSCNGHIGNIIQQKVFKRLVGQHWTMAFRTEST